MAKRRGRATGSSGRAPRFGIGEWYGRSFVNLTEAERHKYAEIALRSSTANAPPCPFIGAGNTPCPKKGGVCSLRLYAPDANSPDDAVAVGGPDGDLRVTCPTRFKQDSVYADIGLVMVRDHNPLIVSEIRFLQRLVAGEESSASSEDVGNIDIVLVNRDRSTLLWCALEIQAVYFSGAGMTSMFARIATHQGNGIPFPDKNRRPDYRSSGPKRLMPQLQIKVPTLRRWGKKMAVVVDAAWFRSNVIDVATVKDISNCDIAWFVIRLDESTDPATMVVGSPEMQTLERAVEGLTGGHPVTLAAFESKIVEKINS